MASRTKVQVTQLNPGTVILTVLVSPIDGRGGVLCPAQLIRGSKPATVTAVAPYTNGRGRRQWRITTSRGVISGCVGLQRVMVANPLDGEPFREGDIEPETPITWHNAHTPAANDPGDRGVFLHYEGGHLPTGKRGCCVKLDNGRQLSTGEWQIRRIAG